LPHPYNVIFSFVIDLCVVSSVKIGYLTEAQLARCLLNAWPRRANEMGSDQSAVRSWHCRLNTFLYWTRFTWQQCAVR